MADIHTGQAGASKGVRFDMTVNVPALLVLLGAGITLYAEHVRLEGRVTAIERANPQAVSDKLSRLDERLLYVQRALDELKAREVRQ